MTGEGFLKLRGQEKKLESDCSKLKDKKNRPVGKAIDRSVFYIIK